jgi:hypothetical protein
VCKIHALGRGYALLRKAVIFLVSLLLFTFYRLSAVSFDLFLARMCSYAASSIRE